MALNTEQLQSKYSEEVQELRRQLKEGSRILNQYKNAHGQIEVIKNEIISEISPITPIPFVYEPRLETKAKSLIEPVILSSDGHMGAVQYPAEIEGFGEFNPELCEERQLDYIRRVIKWVEMHRYAYTINEVSLLSMGDTISGDIHDELRTTNAFPAPVQVVRAAEVLAKQVAMLSPHFDKVKVHFITEDNHGRLTKKPQAKEAGLNNFNYLVGCMAEQHLKNHTNVEFNIYAMLEKVVHVMNRQYLMSHGHGVRGWMGKPIYGIERKVGRESTARMQIIMEELQKAKEVGFHKYIFGHFHVPFWETLYIGNGSVSGTDAYDHREGRHAVPQQLAFMVGNHGEFDYVPFHL